MSGFIPDELRNYIEDTASSRGFCVVEIVARSGRGTLVEVALDKEGGITLDECSDFNRTVMSWMDDSDLFEGRYTFDVCSPGLDRALKTPRDFQWETGKMVKVNAEEPVDGKTDFIGKLVQFDDNAGVTLEGEDGVSVVIAVNNITKAKLWSKI